MIRFKGDGNISAIEFMTAVDGMPRNGYLFLFFLQDFNGDLVIDRTERDAFFNGSDKNSK